MPSNTMDTLALTIGAPPAPSNQAAPQAGPATPATTITSTTATATATATVAASRKHVELSLELKRKLIQEHEHGVPFTLLGKKYHIATSTAANIWRKKDFFLRSRMSGSRKRCNDRSKYKIVNQVTALFVKSMLERNHKIDGEVIKRFARTAAAQCNFKDFHGSNGWLDSFKKRENVCWVRRRGASERAAAAAAAAAGGAQQPSSPGHLETTTAAMALGADGTSAMAAGQSLRRSDSPNLRTAAAAAAVAATANKQHELEHHHHHHHHHHSNSSNSNNNNNNNHHHHHHHHQLQHNHQTTTTNNNNNNHLHHNHQLHHQPHADATSLEAGAGDHSRCQSPTSSSSHSCSWEDVVEMQCSRCSVAAAAAAVAALNSDDSMHHERDHEIDDWFHGIPFLCQFFEDYQAMHQHQQQLGASSGGGGGGGDPTQPDGGATNSALGAPAAGRSIATSYSSDATAPHARDRLHHHDNNNHQHQHHHHPQRQSRFSHKQHNWPKETKSSAICAANTTASPSMSPSSATGGCAAQQQQLATAGQQQQQQQSSYNQQPQQLITSAASQQQQPQQQAEFGGGASSVITASHHHHLSSSISAHSSASSSSASSSSSSSVSSLRSNNSLADVETICRDATQQQQQQQQQQQPTSGQLQRTVSTEMIDALQIKIEQQRQQQQQQQQHHHHHQQQQQQSTGYSTNSPSTISQSIESASNYDAGYQTQPDYPMSITNSTNSSSNNNNNNSSSGNTTTGSQPTESTSLDDPRIITCLGAAGQVEGGNIRGGDTTMAMRSNRSSSNQLLGSQEHLMEINFAEEDLHHQQQQQQTGMRRNESSQHLMDIIKCDSQPIAQQQQHCNNCALQNNSSASSSSSSLSLSSAPATQQQQLQLQVQLQHQHQHSSSISIENQTNDNGNQTSGHQGADFVLQNNGRDQCNADAGLLCVNPSDYGNNEDQEFYLSSSNIRYLVQDAHSDDLLYHDEVSDHNDCCSDHHEPQSGAPTDHHHHHHHHHHDLNFRTSSGPGGDASGSSTNGGCSENPLDETLVGAGCARYMDEYEYENISTIRHYPLVSMPSQLAPMVASYASAAILAGDATCRPDATVGVNSARSQQAGHANGPQDSSSGYQGNQEDRRRPITSQQQHNFVQQNIQNNGGSQLGSKTVGSIGGGSGAGQQMGNLQPSAGSSSYQQQQQQQQHLGERYPNLLGGLLHDPEPTVEHADHEEHNLLHNALMRSPEKLKLIDSIITLLNYATNYNQEMLDPLLDIKRCIERDLEVVLSDTTTSQQLCCRNSGASNTSHGNNNNSNNDAPTDHECIARRCEPTMLSVQLSSGGQQQQQIQGDPRLINITPSTNQRQVSQVITSQQQQVAVSNNNDGDGQQLHQQQSSGTEMIISDI